MGKPMASNLLKAGHALTVYDLVPEAVDALASLGAEPAGSAAAAAAGAEVVVTMVPSSPHVEAAAALRALRELPDTYRETMIMRLVEGLSGPEIAERTGMTPESVRVHLHRGMKLLRERLGGSR